MREYRGMVQENDAYRELLKRMEAIYREGLAEVSLEASNMRTMKMHWDAGREIVEIEQGGKETAPYGTGLLKRLAKDLSQSLPKGVSDRLLTYERKFFNEYEISQLSAKLSWSHYRVLLEVRARKDRRRLEKQAIEQQLSHHALRRVVRRLNGGKLDGEKACQPLTPRVARPNLVKVVTAETAEGPTLLADCGFRQLAALPANAPGALRAGDILEYTERQRGASLRIVSCTRGEQYCYEGHVQSVVDGDTITACLKQCFYRFTIQPLRLRGVNAAELGTPEGDRWKQLLAQRLQPGTPVRVLTYHWDMYGRYVADVFVLNGADEAFLNEELRTGLLQPE